MYGKPALPPDFVSLPYVNPDAPKGGRIVFGEGGSFDSLNPHILKGNAPYGLRVYVFESLMARSWDEPFTLYGLLAESVETGPNREWVQFTLRPEARFSDGNPVTVADVLWSFKTLGTQGDPRYRGAWAKVAKAEAVGPRTVRFTFNTRDRELPLILGLRPVLEKALWKGKNFAETSTQVPIGSGPYVVGKYEFGHFITLKRNPDWWGRNLPINRGKYNFAEIRYDYFADGSVIFQAFKAGVLDSYREFNARKWATAYNFPAVRTGAVVKSEIPNQRPSGIRGFVFNTRRPMFKDWRVRQALIDAFNFEFINKTLNNGAAPRITSYFSNSVLGMSHDTAKGRVRALLAPFRASLLPGTLEGYALPRSNGEQGNRRNIRKALKLLGEAGWHVEGGALKNASGKAFRFNILLKQGATESGQIADIYSAALKRLGIDATSTVVDPAQYQQRTERYDFDMAYYWRGLSLSPGNEQMLYWGHQGVKEPGTRNWMGMDSPAAEAMIKAMLTSPSHADFIAAVHALDRVLTAGRYVIPFWFSRVSYLAHKKQMRYPKRLPIYGDWIGFQPDVWWYQE